MPTDPGAHVNLALGSDVYCPAARTPAVVLSVSAQAELLLRSVRLAIETETPVVALGLGPDHHWRTCSFDCWVNERTALHVVPWLPLWRDRNTAATRTHGRGLPIEYRGQFALVYNAKTAAVESIATMHGTP